MNLIKVLGIGSPFGDDQAGWKVAAELRRQLAIPTPMAPYVLIEHHDRPGVRLIELIRGFNTIFIIDAVKSGSEVGTIHRFHKDALLDSEPTFSTHGISILQALQLAGALNELPANLLFYGIEIDAITLDETLSPQVEQAIGEVTRLLLSEIVITYRF
ncbi:hydrogenase [Legionella qingyii]|uniref:Hydrogenase n=1 Tax=Legionella qingyii TaxID=2184757 RepID=A0A317U115_9GAMM|nr:hydrogenase maturation protease [Legionella qingyii]PWY55059.1 hydrogenase [Legionella qingyii]RUR25515.1 hydrogenase maturation protease [Legionella qingyii]RUR28375.1 hydrogenase maturation protease [Legionella qingyii]